MSLDKRQSERDRIKTLTASHGREAEFFTVGKGKENLAYSRIDSDDVSILWKSGQFANLPNSFHAFESYQNIINHARHDSIDKLLLLEDDVDFTPNFAEVFSSAISQCPKDWDMLYLGANHTWSPTFGVSENVLRLSGSVCWHAVALRHTIFNTILGWSADRPIDKMAADSLHTKYDCYAVWPNIAIQKPSFSNVEGRERDYSEFWKNKGAPAL